MKTLEMEIAKSKSELSCAEADLKKVKGRIAFLLSAVHDLQNRDIKE